MLAPRQIKAARALLGWEAIELSKRTALSRDTIFNIESGRTQAQAGSIERIAQALIDGGVEFTDNQGVRLKPQGVEVLVGQEGLQRFFDGVYEYAKLRGGIIMQLGVEEDLFWAMGVEFSHAHRKRMAELVKERQDIKVLAILCEGDTNFIASDYNQYRWIAKKLFSPVPFYIYGECLAIMNFQTVPSPTIILHKFPAITDAYRKQFEAFWDLSREPDARPISKSAPPKTTRSTRKK